MVKQRKPRKAMHRRVNAMLAKYGKECTWWDFLTVENKMS